VLNMRAMVEAIQHEGAKPKITEYRGVGHVSWNRVYNNPEVIDWMFAQRKP
jgi:predicted peptidase